MYSSAVIVLTCTWLGAASFLAGVQIQSPDLLLHGNPIGIRCVLGGAGAILGLPLGGLLHQVYVRWKGRMSAEGLMNASVGLLIPLGGAHALLGGCTGVQALWGTKGGMVAWAWGLMPPAISLWVAYALGPDARQILRTWWPSLHETIEVVRKALAPAMEWVVDTRFLTRHQVSAIAYTGFLEGPWLVLAPTVTRLRRWSHHAPPRIKQRAQRALASLNLLKHAHPTKLVLPVDHSPPDWGPVRTMLAEATRPGVSLLLSRPMAAIPLPVDSLLLPSCTQVLRSPYRAGDRLELPMLGLGRAPGQARSKLEDGTLVLIAGGALYLGSTVRVRVLHVLHSVTGLLVFAQAEGA